MENVYTVKITNGSIGADQYYIACEYDYLDDICYSDYIVDNYRSYVGMYPDMSDSEWADEEIDDMVRDDIEYTKRLATVKEASELPVLPESVLHEGHEILEEYIKVKTREENIDQIL